MTATRTWPADMQALLRRVSWLRALRAALAVGSAMLACRLIHVPAGAAALGVFFALLADTGGPYRLRLKVTVAVTLADAVAFTLGMTVPAHLALIAEVTVLVCFVAAYGRVLSQTWASLSTFVLVAYFAGLGSGPLPLPAALEAAAASIAGGAWAIALSLALWPVDPFRPARNAVAACYASLAEFTGAAVGAHRAGTLAEDDLRAAHAWQRRQRPLMEAARLALSATTTRAPARTVRAQSLTVLLETSDLLLARTMRLTELADLSEGTLPPGARNRLEDQLAWLTNGERAIANALAARPADGAVAFADGGSVWVDVLPPAQAPPAPGAAALTHLLAEEQTAAAEFKVAFNAVYSFWNGASPERTARQRAAATNPSRPPDRAKPAPAWRDALVENWTLRSISLRHTLRLTLVGLLDVLLMHGLHVNHSFWLPMTSIILLQPYRSGSLRRSLERITGTVAGGVLAAVLAAALPDTLSMTAVITLLAGLTVATYTVNYAVYCFFLTPTFVLLALPHAHDWRFAGVRIGLTLVGAAIAVAAMRLLWPSRAEDELAGLLRRSLTADATYLKTMMEVWTMPPARRRQTGTATLARARRACGLASNDAEEAIDRVMQEPTLGSIPARELALRTEALTLATYIRRFTQSVTTLAEVGRPTPRTLTRLERIRTRMERAAILDDADAALTSDAEAGPMLLDIAEEQLMRLDRQSRVLARAAAAAFLTGA